MTNKAFINNQVTTVGRWKLEAKRDREEVRCFPALGFYNVEDTALKPH